MQFEGLVREANDCCVGGCPCKETHGEMMQSHPEAAASLNQKPEIEDQEKNTRKLLQNNEDQMMNDH